MVIVVCNKSRRFRTRSSTNHQTRSAVDLLTALKAASFGSFTECFMQLVMASPYCTGERLSRRLKRLEEVPMNGGNTAVCRLERMQDQQPDLFVGRLGTLPFELVADLLY